MSYQVPSMAEMLKRIDAKPKKRKAKVVEEAVIPKETVVVEDTDGDDDTGAGDSLTIGQACAKRQKGESGSGKDERVNMSFAKSVCSLEDPKAIEEHVGFLLHEEDLDKLNNMGVKKSSDLLVHRLYQALQCALYTRQDRIHLEAKNKKVGSRNAALSAQVRRLQEQEFVFKANAEKAVKTEAQLRAQLEEEMAARAKSEADGVALRKRMDSVATEAALGARLALMTEFAEGKSSDWDAPSEIVKLKNFLDGVDGEEGDTEEDDDELTKSKEDTVQNATPLSQRDPTAEEEEDDGKTEETTVGGSEKTA